MTLSGIVHYMIPYCTSYFKFFIRMILGFPRAKQWLCLTKHGDSGGIILWALLTVFLDFFNRIGLWPLIVYFKTIHFSKVLASSSISASLTLTWTPTWISIIIYMRSLKRCSRGWRERIPIYKTRIYMYLHSQETPLTHWFCENEKDFRIPIFLKKILSPALE